MPRNRARRQRQTRPDEPFCPVSAGFRDRAPQPGMSARLAGKGGRGLNFRRKSASHGEASIPPPAPDPLPLDTRPLQAQPRALSRGTIAMFDHDTDTDLRPESHGAGRWAPASDAHEFHPHDSLSSYLSDIADQPTLTRAEEGKASRSGSELPSARSLVRVDHPRRHEDQQLLAAVAHLVAAEQSPEHGDLV